jgi:hypothetical protein
MPQHEQKLPGTSDRWQNNPHRRVGHTQLLRAMLATLTENDPLYGVYRAQLDAQANNQPR